jgi:hypothetical protein
MSKHRFEKLFEPFGGASSLILLMIGIPPSNTVGS